MKNITKKFLQVMTSILFVLSSFSTPTLVFADDNQTTITNEDGITLTKSAERINSKLNEWEVTLGLEFAPKVISQDIVIVFDRSGSMANNNRLTNAKAAAKLFTKTLLQDPEIHDNRIALISYSTGAKEEIGFTDDKSAIDNKIDALTADGGTFTQLGLKMARDLLEGSNADNQIVVLLTDGAPTFGFGLKDDGSANGVKKFFSSSPSFINLSNNNSRSNRTVTRNSSGTFNYSDSVSYSSGRLYSVSASVEQNFTENDFNYTLGSGSDMGGHGSSSYKIKSYDDNGTSKRTTLDLFNTNIAEAKIVKQKGNILYTVALDLGGVANAESTLQTMATSLDHYFKASSSNLAAKFQEIADTISFNYSQMSLVDPMGVGFTYVNNSLTYVKGNSNGVVATPNSITWNMSPSSFAYNSTTGKYEMQIKYRIVANADAIPLLEATPGAYLDTNGDARFNYSKNGTSKSSAFPVPKARPTILRVNKVMLDEDGNQVALNDTGNVRVYNYKLTDGSANYTSGLSQNNLYDDYILQPTGAKSIVEESIDFDNINRFIKSYYITPKGGSEQLITNNFTLSPNSGINTVTIKNQPDKDFRHDFEVGKNVFDGNDEIAEANELLTYEIVITNTSNEFIRDLHIQDTLEDIVDYVNINNASLNIKRNGTTTLTSLTVNDLIAGFTTHLAAGEVLTLTFTVVVKANVTLPPDLENTVVVNHLTADADIETGQAIIDFSKSVEDENKNEIAEPGEELTYSITITNSGNVDKNNLSVKEDLSLLLPYIEDISGVMVSGYGADFELSDLVAGITVDVAANSTIVLEFTVKVIAGLKVKEVEELTNIVLVDDEPTDVDIPTGAPEIIFSKGVSDASGDGKAEAGEYLTYTILIQNTGNLAKKNLTVKDDLADLIPYVDIPTDAIYTIDGVTKPLSELMAGITVDVNPGQTIMIVFSVRVKTNFKADEKEFLRNIVTVGGEDLDVDIPTGASKISVDKSVLDANDNGHAEAGEALTYTITIINSGDVDAKNLEVKDDLANLLPHLKDTTGVMVSGYEADKPLSSLINGFNINIDAGESIVLVFTVIVSDDLDYEETPILSNLVTVGEEDGEADIPTGAPKISVDKSVTDATGDGRAEAGEALTYTITITNSGNLDAKDLTVKDDLADLLPHLEDTTGVMVSGYGADRPLANLISGFNIDIEAGETIVLTFTVVVSEDLDADEVTTLRNIVTVGDEDDDADIPTGAPKISVDKSVADASGDGRAEAGEALTYTIIITNSGNVDKNNLLVRDDLADLLPHLEDTTGVMVSGYGADRPLTDLIGGFTIDIAKGTTITLTFTVVVSEDLDADEVTTLRNIVTVGEEDDNADIPTGAPKISVDKSVSDASGDGKAEAGEALTYTIIITNSGNVDANGLEVKDDLADLLPHLENTSGVMVSGYGADRPLADLIAGFEIDIAKGATITLVFTVVVSEDLDADEIKVLRNVVTVGDEEDEEDIPTGKPEIVFNKSVSDANGDGYAEASENLTYTITIENKGNVLKEDLFVQDDLAELLPYIDLAADAIYTIDGVVKPLSELMSGIYIDIDAGEIITIVFTVKVSADFDADEVEVLRNIVTVGDEEDEEDIPTGAPKISVDKSVSDESGDGYAEAGEELTYTITITNSGNVVKKALLVRDDLSDLLPHLEDTTGVMVSGYGADQPLANLINGFIIDIAAGETITLTFSVIVSNELDTDEVKVLRNIVTVGDEEDEEDIPTGKPEIIFNKSVSDASGDGFAEAGEELTYTITITNSGNVIKENLLVRDDLADLLAHLEDTSGVMVSGYGADKPLAELIAGFTIDIAANETITLVFTVRVSAELDADEIEFLRNIVTVGDEEDEEDIPTGKPKIVFNKSVSDASGDGFAETGEELTYTITITNSGNVIKEDLLVKDDLADLLAHLEDTSGVMVSGYGADRPLAELITGFEIDIAANETITLVFTVRVSAELDADEIEFLRNIVTVGDKEDEEDIPTGKPEIVFDKVVFDASGDGFAEASENLTYTITIENKGNVVKKSLFVQDDLADLLPHINLDADATFTINGEVRLLSELMAGFTIDVDAGDIITIVFTVKVSAELDADEILTLRNTVLVGEDEKDVDIPTGAPKISFEKVVSDASEDGFAEAGEELTYTITITNSGNVVKKALFIKDDLADLLPHIDLDADATFTINGDERLLSELINGIIVDIDPEEVITITFMVRVSVELDANEVLVLRNAVLVGEEETDVEIPTGAPEIVFSKVVLDATKDGYAEANETLTYTITIENLGNVVKYELLVVDDLADLLPHIDLDADAIFTIDGEERLLSELMAGIYVDVDVDQLITIVFSVKVSADLDADEVLVLRNTVLVGDEEDEEDIPTGSPKIEAAKFVVDENENNLAEVGEQLTYTILVTNSGNVVKEAVFVIDTLSEILPYIEDVSGEFMTVNGVIRPLADLMNGFYVDLDVEETIEIVFSVTVREDIEDVDELVNNAYVDEIVVSARIDVIIPEVLDEPPIEKPKTPTTGISYDTMTYTIVLLAGITLLTAFKRKKRL